MDYQFLATTALFKGLNEKEIEGIRTRFRDIYSPTSIKANSMHPPVLGVEIPLKPTAPSSSVAICTKNSKISL